MEADARLMREHNENQKKNAASRLEFIAKKRKARKSQKWPNLWLKN